MTTFRPRLEDPPPPETGLAVGVPPDDEVVAFCRAHPGGWCAVAQCPSEKDALALRRRLHKAGLETAVRALWMPGGPVRRVYAVAPVAAATPDAPAVEVG